MAARRSVAGRAEAPRVEADAVRGLLDELAR